MINKIVIKYIKNNILIFEEQYTPAQQFIQARTKEYDQWYKLDFVQVINNVLYVIYLAE